MTDVYRRLTFPLAALLLLPASAVRAQAPLFFTLANGLKACVLEDHSTDLTSVHVVLHVTADCEPDDKAGLRALVQNTMRFGWELGMKSGPNLSFLADMDDANGGLSASADWEYVDFSYAGTAETLPQGLAFLAKNVFAPELTQTAFDGATKVLTSALQERSGPGESTHALFRLALTGSAPRAYPLGTSETLAHISLADLTAFHHRFYLPNLAAVCVAGPTPAAEAKDLIEKSFGPLTPGKAELPEPPVREDSDSRVAANPGLAIPGDTDIEVASLVVGVPAPAYDDADFPVASVIQAVLGPDRNAPGRIDHDEALWTGLGLGFTAADAHKRAFIEGLPPQISARNYLALQAYVAPVRAEPVREDLLRYFEAFATNPPSAAELARAKECVRTRNALAYEGLQNRCLMMARAVVVGLPGPLVTEFDSRVENVTAQDVQRVARRFFARHAVGVEYPEVTSQ